MAAANNIGVEGASHIGDVLKMNTIVTTLVLESTYQGKTVMNEM